MIYTKTGLDSIPRNQAFDEFADNTTGTSTSLAGARHKESIQVIAIQEVKKRDNRIY